MGALPIFDSDRRPSLCFQRVADGYGVWMSLQNVDVVRGTSSFIGLGNYLRLFQDGQFGLSVLNTAWYTLTVVPLIVIGSIAIAVFLRESRPARLIARVGFYIPFVLSPVVVATSWKWLLNEDLGVIDGFLKCWDVHDYLALGRLFCAGKCRPGFRLESGRILYADGFGRSEPNQSGTLRSGENRGRMAWQRFWHITLPMLRPTILLIVILALVHATQALRRFCCSPTAARRCDPACHLGHV